MEIYSKSSDLEFYHKENMLNLLYYSIENKWQAEDTIEMLKKLENDNNIYDWDKSKFKTTETYLIYYFISENDGLKIAEDNLDLGEICRFLLNIYQNDEKKQIDILEKAIEQNKKYSNEKYYQQLLNIYKDKNKQKYLEILKEYFVEHKDIKIYRELKKHYKKNEWVKIKENLLKTLTDNEESYWNKNILRDICVEEDDYDALINLLKDEWIGTINNYFKLLAKYRPAQLLILYKSKNNGRNKMGI